MPDFIIIGAMRSATSTLSSYLFEHPKIHIVEGKEVHFFSDEKIYNKGVDWYLSKFLNIPEGEIIGEASPSYLNATLAPGRIKNLLPDVKIILCVRNPGERSISHFFWNKSIQLEQHSFEEMFSDDNISEANHYIGNSMYAKGFYWWLHFFDPSQIAVVCFDEIVNSPQNVMSELFDFLNVNPINLSSTIHHYSTHWQDEHYKYKEVLFKINQYVYDDVSTFLQILQDSGNRVIGDPESIMANYKKAVKISPNLPQLQSILISALETTDGEKDIINLNPNINLALNKPTAQSSVYQPEQYGYDPHGACNGKKTGEFGFHTLKEDQPWWQIDLQGIDQLSYQLFEIKIYNRIHYKERACTLNVLLSQDALNWELCYSNDKENIFGGIDGKPLIVNLPHKLARFVRLQLRENEYLHLDEVEIYGIPFKPKDSELDCNQDDDHLYVNFYGHLPDDLEARFSAQNGIDSSLMKGKSFLIYNYETTDTYKLLRFVEIDQLHQDSLISDITAISVTRGLRFGNSIQQLSHAYNIAKAIGVSKIYLPNFWYIAEGKSNISSGIQIINVNKPDFSSEKMVLEGLFFENKTLAPLSNIIPNHYSAMIDLIEAVNLKHSAEPLGEQDLVIHIRSGDVFQKNPQSGYGQPPLSFYKKIVKLPIWHSISLVFEDKSNPIIDPLIDFAKQHCLQVQEISGDIRYDIDYLLRAKILVVGGGTFAPAIAALSRNLRTVYSFLGNFITWGNPNISCIIVGDKQDIYSSEILSNNWQNTESQRKLMLEYPMDTLYFAEPIQLFNERSNQVKSTEIIMSPLSLGQNAAINLALNKPTAQSSVYGYQNIIYDPYGACNGKKTGKFGFHTLKEDQPWWQIDLQGVYQLSEIKIYNRINCKERACTLNVLLSQDALNWELCYSNDQEHLFGGVEGSPLLVDTQQKVARYVRLQLRANEYFHLDEVEIYGIAVTPDNSQLKSSQDESTLSANFYAQAALPPSPHVMQNLIMNMLSKLRIHDTDMGKIRIGSQGDGGYVVPNDLTDIKGVVSIGIGGEVSFDQYFAEMGVKVFQYDHTIEAPPVMHENFVFNKLGWGTQDGDGFITLSKIIENNGLENSDLILKFDVENAEWDALFDVSPDLLRRFRIITCELHGFDALENISVFQKVNQVINLLTTHHAVVHIHPNNCCGMALVAGVVLPKLIEFSFLRNDRASFYPSHQSIPSDLDYPNVQSQPEIILTPFHINIQSSIPYPNIDKVEIYGSISNWR